MKDNKKQNYFKWIFTRWYFYIIAGFSFIISTAQAPQSFIELLGTILGYFLFSFIIIYIFGLGKKAILGIISLFKKS